MNNERKKIVILTGAGISKASGLDTFLDKDGLWRQYDVDRVCSKQAWKLHPERILEFYNERRNQISDCKPNIGHDSLVKLERKFDVTIITQNVDDLHERAGSEKVIHIHGNIFQSRSSRYSNLIYDQYKDINIGDTCDEGFQLRPNIVLFGEKIQHYPLACRLVRQADILITIGTSLNIPTTVQIITQYIPDCVKYYIDPKPCRFSGNIEFREKAEIILPTFVDSLIEKE